ncbi:MAG: hypothetical protein SynsKO_12030 [Synoicihabitans sp.]
MQVALAMALPTRGDQANHSFYRASTTTATLGTGAAVFRFYLTPAVVDRDRISRDVRFWAVDLSVAGTPMPATRATVGSGFSSGAALENFRRKISEEAPPNDGVLLPLHLVPAGLLPGGDPPAVRPEAVGDTRG